MKIGIDARFVGPQGTGLGKYTEKLISNLQKIDRTNNYVIFLKENNWQYLNIRNKNFQKKLANVSWYSFDEQLKMPAIFSQENLDLLHIPHFNVPFLYNKPFIVTIHDLIHHEFSQESVTTKNPIIYKIKRFGYNKIFDHAIKNSKQIITPSKYIKNSLQKKFNVSSQKIKVIYEAAEEAYSQNKSNQTKKNYLLYVGNAYPHKNLTILLDALTLIPKIKLKIVCSRDVFWERLKKDINSRNIDSRVDLLGYKNTPELSRLFFGAVLYVTPSRSEGFGIPALNAMNAGVPVAASDIPTHREIYKNAAAFFDPMEKNDIAKVINKILKNAHEKEILIQNGYLVASRYSWQQMAKQTLEIYNKSV